MRKILNPVVLVLLLFSVSSNAQNKPRNNSLSFELGKNGLICNLTYDHQFPMKFGIRAGGGSNFSSSFAATTFGGGVYYLFGKTKRFLETGFDLYHYTFTLSQDDVRAGGLVYPNFPTNALYPSANIGFRSYAGKAIFRIGFSPGYINSEFIPGGYVGLGVRF